MPGLGRQCGGGLGGRRQAGAGQGGHRQPGQGVARDAALNSAQRAAIPLDGIAVVVHELGRDRAVLQWRADEPMNPASVMKLPTTLAALDRLGPAFTWATPMWLTGPLKDGVLEGDLVIQGRGDPKLVVERLWLALRKLRQMGLREIRGDIVLDSRAFAVPDTDPGEFDGERLRPYNAQSAALLLNFRSSIYSFVPDAAAGVARVTVDTPLVQTEIERSVPLAPAGTPCGDWRANLKASFEPRRTRFAGSYAAACGELFWPVADAQPASYDARLLGGLWQEIGGTLAGRVREGSAPADTAPTLELRSPSLAEVVRDINKFSNNVMAQQLLLTLALQAAPTRVATPEAARELLGAWLAERTGALDAAVVIDNGSGLSRRSRLSAWRPAHLKTGSLREVMAVAGYVLSDSGRRYVLVAVVNHAQAGAARPALDALTQWVVRDAPAR
ncbi:MAG: hypothetical protein RL227_2695 [Pseudomonadota bacterium]